MNLLRKAYERNPDQKWNFQNFNFVNGYQYTFTVQEPFQDYHLSKSLKLIIFWIYLIDQISPKGNSYLVFRHLEGRKILKESFLGPSTKKFRAPQLGFPCIYQVLLDS